MTDDGLSHSIGEVLGVDGRTHDAMEQFMPHGVFGSPVRVDKDVSLTSLVLLNDKALPTMVLRRVARVFTTKHTTGTVRVERIDEFVLLEVSLEGGTIVHVQTGTGSHGIKADDDVVVGLVVLHP